MADGMESPNRSNGMVRLLIHWRFSKYYDDLKAKSLVALAEDNGLISTRKGKLTKEVLDSIHFRGNGFRDIVDWPHSGLAGNENAASGETDGFVFFL